MRIGRIVGRVTLSRSYPTLAGGRFMVVEVQDRFSLAGKPRRTTDTAIVYDHLGAHQGDLIAFTDGREASNPFYPERRVPLDAYNAAILDAAVIEYDIERRET
jgi:ethanolamine utilization protein EutN